MEPPIKFQQNIRHFILQAPPAPPLFGSYSNTNNFAPWASAVRYLGLMLDSKPLFTRHLHTALNKDTGIFCNFFSLLARYSAIIQSNNVTIYKLIMRFILTFAAPPAPPHALATTSDSRLSSQNVSESSVIIPDVPPLSIAQHTKH